MLKAMITLQIPDVIMKTIASVAAGGLKKGMVEKFEKILNKGTLKSYFQHLSDLVTEEGTGKEELDRVKKFFNDKIATTNSGTWDKFLSFEPPITFRLRDGTSLTPMSKMRVGSQDEVELNTYTKGMAALLKNIKAVEKVEANNKETQHKCSGCWFSEEYMRECLC